jgi:hypothetical protein
MMTRKERYFSPTEEGRQSPFPEEVNRLRRGYWRVLDAVSGGLTWLLALKDRVVGGRR